ncbi:uncharacterized protein LOC120130608 [Hibiscus syriacus]|uniref:uncharacterized protein LOC120130608 n=1 Tax=Hibiscus syriacus TaxID=106335 RepID=UPI001923CFE2|nr:uncharacterized protein LOC120130608 [Hibiscus syriacus]
MAERRNVLAEKHRRGEAVRLVRATMKGRRKQSADVGTKLQNHSHQSRPSKKRKTTEPESRMIGKTKGKASMQRFGNAGNNYRVPSSIGQVKKKQKSRLRVSNTSSHGNPGHFTVGMSSIHHSNDGPVLNSYQPHRHFHHRSVPHQFTGYDIGTTSTMCSVEFVDLPDGQLGLINAKD